MPNFYGQNYNMMNQLLRQRDNIENLINQCNQPPVQNIINTGGLDFEARILQENEDIDNILINRRTMFLDKANKKLIIKELDGKISEEYDLIIPLDEKDMHIKTLEEEIAKLKNDILQIKQNAQQPNVIEQKEKEDKYHESTKPTKSNNAKQKSLSNANEHDDTATETNG